MKCLLFRVQWDNFDENDVALSLTHCEFTIYEAISPKEFLYWNKKNRFVSFFSNLLKLTAFIRAEMCKGIQAMIAFSNHLSAW
jgi:hypothetical protein